MRIIENDFSYELYEGETIKACPKCTYACAYKKEDLHMYKDSNERYLICPKCGANIEMGVKSYE